MVGHQTILFHCYQYPQWVQLNHQLLPKAQYPKNQRKDLKVHPAYHLLHLRNRSTRDHFYTSQASPARGPSSGHASLQYLECQASSVAQLVTVTYRVPNKVSKMWKTTLTPRHIKLTQKSCRNNQLCSRPVSLHKMILTRYVRCPRFALPFFLWTRPIYFRATIHSTQYLVHVNRLK